MLGSIPHPLFFFLTSIIILLYYLSFTTLPLYFVRCEGGCFERGQITTTYQTHKCLSRYSGPLFCPPSSRFIILYASQKKGDDSWEVEGGKALSASEEAVGLAQNSLVHKNIYMDQASPRRKHVLLEDDNNKPAAACANSQRNILPKFWINCFVYYGEVLDVVA